MNAENNMHAIDRLRSIACIYVQLRAHKLIKLASLQAWQSYASYCSKLRLRQQYTHFNKQILSYQAFNTSPGLGLLLSSFLVVLCVRYLLR